jgi:D-alanyl-D-alanine carboxypeptidase
MAKLAVEVSKHPEILEAGATETYVLSATNSHSEEREIENSNPLMHVLKNHPEYGEFYYEYATGLKTGTVNNIRPEGEEEIISSYGSVVASADKDGLSLIALIFGDESERETDNGTQRSYKRWQLAADLFDFGFENYAWVDLGQYIQPVSLTRPVDTEENEGIQAGTFSVGSQNDAAVEAVLLDSASADGLENGTLKLEEEIDIQGALPYYVQVGDTVGTVEYMLDGSPVYSADLVVTGQTLSEGEEESGLADGPSSADEALPGWFWWVIIPAAAVGVLFLVRAVNLSRRSHYRRRKYRRPRH